MRIATSDKNSHRYAHTIPNTNAHKISNKIPHKVAYSQTNSKAYDWKANTETNILPHSAYKQAGRRNRYKVHFFNREI